MPLCRLRRLQKGWWDRPSVCVENIPENHKKRGVPMAETYVERAAATSSSFRRVSWAAVFAGVVITLVVQALLTLLGIGIGAANVEPLRQSDPGRGLGIGA